MEDLIMKIIDIEDRAQEVIKDAKKADRELEERIKDESRKMRDDITRRMEAKNVTLKQIEEEDADKKVEAIRVIWKDIFPNSKRSTTTIKTNGLMKLYRILSADK